MAKLAKHITAMASNPDDTDGYYMCFQRFTVFLWVPCDISNYLTQKAE